MKRTLYITATLPALTVTFIYREIDRLRKLGMEIETVSMNTPADDEISAAAKTLRQTTHYLDQITFLQKLGGLVLVLCTRPLRMLRCIGHVITARPIKFPKDTLRLAYHLVAAAHLATVFKNRKLNHIHCHFINGPTSIGMFLAIILDIPYSFTMHASMIWLDPIGFANKLKTCAFCVSISEYNRKYVLDTYGSEYADKLHVIHCGIDPESRYRGGVKRKSAAKFTILGVGQLNRRKGFHILIPALAELRKRGVDFECTIIGNGSEMPVLQNLVDRDKLHDCIKLAGAVLHEDVQRHLQEADAFVLPCVISEDGWRDGIPVALMEAMFNELPVVSTDILGLPELIHHDVNGILVPAGDVPSLTAALCSLAQDEQKRAMLGKKGRETILQEFNNAHSAAMLKSLMDSC
jgi:glycosyltransferase involved in cell wall biosynthesis